jgi:hypothetical protein
VKRVRAALLIVAAFLAGLGGAWLGQRFADRTAPSGGAALHRMLHEELDLDAGQAAALARLEQRYAVRRRAYEMEMRADNAHLADAIALEHGKGPRVDAAIEASHHAMGELQKETITHVFAMRQLLRPDQARRFDQAVAKALIDDGR